MCRSSTTVSVLTAVFQVSHSHSFLFFHSFCRTTSGNKWHGFFYRPDATQVTGKYYPLALFFYESLPYSRWKGHHFLFSDCLIPVSVVMIFSLAASGGKRNVTVWRPSVCPSLSLPSIYSLSLTRWQHATQPTYILA